MPTASTRAAGVSGAAGAAKAIRTVVAAVAALAALVVAGPTRAETVRLGGTGSAIGTMQRLGEAYQALDPEFQLQIVPNLGSSGGIRAVATGAVQIGAVSRPLKPAEAAKGLSAIRYGRTAFVVVTRETGVHSLTPDELAAMYDSPEARWPDGTPVRPVLRPASDNDSRLLAAFSPAVSTALTKAMAREGMVVGMTDQETVDAVERLPGAIGTASMALLLSEQRRVTPLALAGVAPSLANVASGRYPHSKTMALVLRSDAPEAARRFVAFVGSEAGRRLLKSLGHVTDEPGAAGASPSAGPTGR